MLRKLGIRTWFGALPPWTEEFKKSVEPLKEFGWDFAIMNDYQWFKREAEMQIGVEFPEESLISGTRKCGDWDPMIGEIFQEMLKTGGYDYWFHFNLDAVYGRLSKWVPDDFLENIDIFGNDPGAVCGPFTAYRNCDRINALYKRCPTWRENILDPNFRGWDELDFSRAVGQESLKGNIVFASGFFQAHDHIDEEHKQRQELHFEPDGSLIDDVTGREIMLYHMNQTRRWCVK